MQRLLLAWHIQHIAEGLVPITAVITFKKIVHVNFPVRPQVHGVQGRDRVAKRIGCDAGTCSQDLFLQTGPVLRYRQRVLVEIDENKIKQTIHPHRAQADIVLRRLLAGRGSAVAEQSAIQVVTPLMIRTNDDIFPARTLEQPVTTVRADVVKGLEVSLFIPNYKDVLAKYFGCDIGALPVELGNVAGILPAFEKYLLLLPGQYGLFDIVAGRQGTQLV